MRPSCASIVTVCLVMASSAISFAQSLPQQASTGLVPRVVNISGTFKPANGQISEVEVVTLSIYADETASEPLWQETQSINVDPSGRYTLLLGATQADGVPVSVFASGDARWLTLRSSRPGELEGARTRITSVPYALRAADADTLGGRPASDYVLSPAAGGETTTTTTSAPVTAAVVTPGTTNFVSKYVNGTDVGQSALFESGGFVGLNTTLPKDIFHSVFADGTGNYTGIAVQNLSSAAAAYSGMLFYDHAGALTQFQGFNNSTKEYRINNIAANGSINFMLGGTSRFQITPSGNIGIGVASPTVKLAVGGDVSSTGDFRPLGTAFYGVRWVDGTGTIQAHIHRWGLSDNRLYITNAGSSDLTGVYLNVGGTSLTSTSDERLKTDIEPLTGILDKIKNIRVVGFNMAGMGVSTTGKAEVRLDMPRRSMRNGKVIKQQIGSIAQDWIASFPELVVEPGGEDQYYGLDYDRIGVVALGAAKELTTLVTDQANEIQALKARLAALEELVRQLTAAAGKQ